MISLSANVISNHYSNTASDPIIILAHDLQILFNTPAIIQSIPGGPTPAPNPKIDHIGNNLRERKKEAVGVMASSAAQDEFNGLMYGAGRTSPSQPHPEDVHNTSESEPRYSPRSSNRSSPYGGKTIRSGGGHGRNRRASLISHLDSDSECEESTLGSPPRGTRGHGDDGGSLSRPGSRAMSNSKTGGRYFIPRKSHDANTGPKGVITDAQAYEQAKRAHRTRMSAHASKSDLVLGIDSSASTFHGNNVSYLPPLSSLSSQSATMTHSGANWFIDERDEDDLDGLDDDDFMRTWRQNRLRELERQAERGRRGFINSGKGPGRRWGMMTTVDGDGYLNAIEKVDSDVVVLVYIYDDRVSFTFCYSPSLVVFLRLSI